VPDPSYSAYKGDFKALSDICSHSVVSSGIAYIYNTWTKYSSFNKCHKFRKEFLHAPVPYKNTVCIYVKGVWATGYIVTSNRTYRRHVLRKEWTKLVLASDIWANLGPHMHKKLVHLHHRHKMQQNCCISIYKDNWGSETLCIYKESCGSETLRYM